MFIIKINYKIHYLIHMFWRVKMFYRKIINWSGEHFWTLNCFLGGGGIWLIVLIYNNCLKNVSWEPKSCIDKTSIYNFSDFHEICILLHLVMTSKLEKTFNLFVILSIENKFKAKIKFVNIINLFCETNIEVYSRIIFFVL